MYCKNLVKPGCKWFAYFFFLILLLPEVGHTQQGSYRIAWLKKGYPMQIQQVLDRLRLPTPSHHAVLDTGIEGLTVHFGPLTVGKKMLAWFAGVQHDTLAAFSYGVPLQYRPHAQVYVATFKLSLFYDAGEIPVEVWYNPASGTVAYTWPGYHRQEETATIEAVSIDLLQGQQIATFQAED